MAFTINVNFVMSDRQSCRKTDGTLYSGTIVTGTINFNVLLLFLMHESDIREGTIRADSDIKMTGYVSWAGSTSMEVTMTLQQVGFSMLMTKYCQFQYNSMHNPKGGVHFFYYPLWCPSPQTFGHNFTSNVVSGSCYKIDANAGHPLFAAIYNSRVDH